MSGFFGGAQQAMRLSDIDFEGVFAANICFCFTFSFEIAVDVEIDILSRAVEKSALPRYSRLIYS